MTARWRGIRSWFRNWKVAERAAPGELADVKSLTYDAVMRDKVVIGSPETVAARLSDLQDQLGIDGILAELNFGAMISADRMMRSLQLLLREVRPRLRAV